MIGYILDMFVVSSSNESCHSSRVLIAGVEIVLNLSHIPPLGMLFSLIELSGLIIIALSSDVLNSSSLSDSYMTISCARMSIISYVGVVAGVVR